MEWKYHKSWIFYLFIYLIERNKSKQKKKDEGNDKRD